MLLSKLIVQHFGPFANPTEICFEPDVTVFTGANDCGKSSVLNLIELICAMKDGNRLLQEHEVNFDRIGTATTTWTKDREVTCDAFFIGTSFSPQHVEGKFGKGHELSVLCRLPPECRNVEPVKWRKDRAEAWSTGRVEIKNFPRILRLPAIDSIRPVIDLESPQQSEREFLRAAFGSQFSFRKYATLSDAHFYAALSKARGDTNAKLRHFLPPSVGMEFDFQTAAGDRRKLSVQLRDHNDAHTSLAVRGSGIQRLISLMGMLLADGLDDCHYIILIDEPEISLHADAQHRFRAVLEALAEKPNIQVAYATHSPSMINPIRTTSIRLLRRQKSGTLPTTIIEHRPIDENFLSVRSSLGITPPDSLLYAPVTVIVEGPTEVIGIPLILGRLWKSEVDGFEKVGRILPQIHLLDGCGDSFDILCKFAFSQGTRPVVFLDGDKSGSRLNKLKARFPEVPIVLIEGRKEFEELVPAGQFFVSLASVMAEFHDEALEKLTETQFLNWEDQQKLPVQMAFSKRVDRWVQDTIELSIEKPLVMKHALQHVQLDDVDKGPLQRLVVAIHTELQHK